MVYWLVADNVPIGFPQESLCCIARREIWVVSDFMAATIAIILYQLSDSIGSSFVCSWPHTNVASQHAIGLGTYKAQLR
jgi:hypothetical protein